ncbi:hypothetical protein [Streptomyces sp. MJP52]|uniref:hypothetical protein n=1 Tax=Streptomyces sp. MJP52 TaxID=2940555 RepID=UPI002476D599|nr:hypothetical protein [Streptomyces sp. MJP52]MDH6228902.1 hypothetical protein [Streptomyces sp. MJP52]
MLNLVLPPTGFLIEVPGCAGRTWPAEGLDIDPEDLAQVSPYLTEHIRRAGEYSTHELGDEPAAYDPRLDIDFIPLRGEEPVAAGCTAA